MRESDNVLIVSQAERWIYIGTHSLVVVLQHPGHTLYITFGHPVSIYERLLGSGSGLELTAS